MKVKYFAWVRERIGRPRNGRAAAECSHRSRLIGWLSARDESYAYAFEKPRVIRAAIDHTHVKPETAIAGASEIAFFPPMTGG